MRTTANRKVSEPTTQFAQAFLKAMRWLLLFTAGGQHIQHRPRFDASPSCQSITIVKARSNFLYEVCDCSLASEARESRDLSRLFHRRYRSNPFQHSTNHSSNWAELHCALQPTLQGPMSMKCQRFCAWSPHVTSICIGPDHRCDPPHFCSVCSVLQSPRRKGHRTSRSTGRNSIASRHFANCGIHGRANRPSFPRASMAKT